MLRHFRHQGGRGHAGLRIDLQPDQLALAIAAIIESEIGSTDAAATDRLMRLHRQ